MVARVGVSEEGLTKRGRAGEFWGDGTVLYLGFGGCFITMYLSELCINKNNNKDKTHSL